MDDWPDPFSQIFEAIAHEAEQLFQGVVKEAKAAVEQLVLVSDSIEAQLEQTIVPEIELLVEQANQAIEPLADAISPEIEAVATQINEVIEPLVEPLFEIWFLDFEPVANPLTPPDNQEPNLFDPPQYSTEDPFLQHQLPHQHLTCVGCRHYHGQVYGDTLLVCAMHPYGPDIAECPDWESAWRQDK